MSLMTEPPSGAAEQPAGASPGTMTKRAAQGQATRDHLIQVATGLFAGHGYENTSIEAVLAAAGVSRGALYHHFAGKDALFEAVFTAVQTRVIAELAEVISDAPDAVTMLRKAALGWIGLAGDPVVQRITIIDAPAVLGWERWRALCDRHALGELRMLMQAVADEGCIPAGLADPFTHMLMAGLDEIALVIARSDDPATAKTQGRAAVEELVRRLVTP